MSLRDGRQAGFKASVFSGLLIAIIFLNEARVDLHVARHSLAYHTGVYGIEHTAPTVLR